MAKKRKPAAKTATRRTPRRGKKAAAEASATAGETSVASESVAPDAPTEQTPGTSKHSAVPSDDQPPTDASTTAPTPNLVPTVVLHKKFGKYRCLFNNDDTFSRKYDVGSDSETNSSLDVRIVDPGASSESDSNAALDTHSDTNSGACLSPINSNSNILQAGSRDISPVPMMNEMTPTIDIPLPGESENVEMNAEIELELVPLPPPRDVVPSKQESVAKEDVVLIEETKDAPEQEIPLNDISQDILLEDEQIEYAADDDEMITIVQIVEDDNPELYYDIQIDSPKNPSPVPIQMANEEDVSKQEDADFQKHFEQLNLAISVDSEQSSPMDCLEMNRTPCSTPDIKDSLDILTRPDPSLTPSSTLSDDSNSSRITEQNQNNSNDSAESSPTGVRRSNRIKTISNMKQKTKGYGLVKTPLKKALITQTKLKLEELGSDSQEKSTDTTSNGTPNSPSFPVPSDMPVKVKSRWRRSSELEMGANSPASSPLASPSLPTRMQAISEVQNTEEDQQVPPLSKEAYEKIIEERMNQYQHLEENEYLCERMISKETKKMICDCFLTKEELERGELACGEDCLNRLLMIEW